MKKIILLMLIVSNTVLAQEYYAIRSDIDHLKDRIANIEGLASDIKNTDQYKCIEGKLYKHYSGKIYVLEKESCIEIKEEKCKLNHSVK